MITLNFITVKQLVGHLDHFHHPETTQKSLLRKKHLFFAKIRYLSSKLLHQI